jgi:2-dehydropantoate 2-reductase
MNICILGCGAMGSIYATLLAEAGHEVTAVDRNAEHVAAINARGLRVHGASGDRTATIRALAQAPAEPMDLVVCAAKAAGVADAAQALGPMLSDRTLVLTIQNGLGSADRIAEVIGPDRLLVGVAQGFGASLQAPGVAHHNDMKALRFGPYAGRSTTEAERIAKVWADAGFDAAAVSDIAAMQWEKLICNVAYSAPCAITGLTVGQVLAHPHVSKLSAAAAQEAYEVALAQGLALRFDDPVIEIQDFGRRMPDARPSVHLDLLAGRVSEVGVINGAVVAKAAEAGLRAPVNETLTTLVQSLEETSRTSPVPQQDR